MDLTIQTSLPHPTSPHTRGIRVRYIRETLLRYTRRKFSEQYAVPAPTLQNWETGKYGGLTEKGALKLVEAFQGEGVPCSVEWLLYGIGAQPVSAPTTIRAVPSINEAIARELGLFRQLHPNAVDAIVVDYSMAPCLYIGDLVAGERYFRAEISKAAGQYCIVQLTGGEVLIRELRSGPKVGQYILLCINSKSKPKTQILTEESIFSVAPIMWIRRTLNL